jgi:high affinity Mn2+ porin
MGEKLVIDHRHLIAVAPYLMARSGSRVSYDRNFEQQLAPGLGVLARASMSQGTVAEVEFTDINQSISAGLS